MDRGGSVPAVVTPVLDYSVLTARSLAELQAMVDQAVAAGAVVIGEPICTHDGMFAQAIGTPRPVDPPDPGQDGLLVAFGSLATNGHASLAVHGFSVSSGLGASVGSPMAVGGSDTFEAWHPIPRSKGYFFVAGVPDGAGPREYAAAFAVSAQGVTLIGQMDITAGVSPTGIGPKMASDGAQCFVALDRANLGENLVLTLGEVSAGTFQQKGNALVIDPGFNFSTSVAFRVAGVWAVAIEELPLSGIRCWFRAYSHDGTDFVLQHNTDLTSIELGGFLFARDDCAVFLNADWTGLEFIRYSPSAGFSHAGTVPLADLDSGMVLDTLNDAIYDPATGKLWVSLFNADWTQWAMFVCDVDTVTPSLEVSARLDGLTEGQMYGWPFADVLTWYDSVGDAYVFGHRVGTEVTPLEGSISSSETYVYHLWY